jgi:hypothetical protein
LSAEVVCVGGGAQLRLVASTSDVGLKAVW